MLPKLCSCLICLVLATPAGAGGWSLLGRDGCIAVGPGLAARIPVAAHIDGPDAYVRLMQAAGGGVIRQDEYRFCGRRASVRVPALGLAMTFIESDACDCDA